MRRIAVETYERDDLKYEMLESVGQVGRALLTIPGRRRVDFLSGVPFGVQFRNARHRCFYARALDTQNLMNASS